MHSNYFTYDEQIRQQENIQYLCGVDEAGRGPLAGPVYAAAVILPADFYDEDLADSKKLTEKKRERLFDVITENALCFAIAFSTPEEIDDVNILNATFMAMERAVFSLPTSPQLVLIDGNQRPKKLQSARTVIKGDATSASIAAASVLAKVSRDRFMCQLGEIYPQYQLAKHKGYPTKLHFQLLDEHGSSIIHRKTFLKKRGG